MIQELQNGGLSAYVHIPFCERKCIYCDFYSIENLSLRESFVELLLKEIDLKIERYPSLEGRELHTIFFGGGTPSLLTPNELARIIAGLTKYFTISQNCEFTLECNPGTVSLEKLSGYRALGVNRLSFGVQSFDQAELDFLGRIHDAHQARDAVRLAREAGFDNVSIDLIFSLPNQSEETLNRTLDEAIALDTDHISAYNLIVEHGTPLFRLVQLERVIELDSDHAATLFELVQRRLREAGFAQYEISNYAKTSPPVERSGIGGGRGVDRRARHNLVYWDGFSEYVSFGPSAHEFIAEERAWNVSSLEQYRSMIEAGKLPRINSEHVSTDERRTEVLYVQLRSTGVRLEQFKHVFEEDLLLNEEVQYLLRDGMLIHDEEKSILRLSETGYRFCDGIVSRLMQNTRVELSPQFVIQ